jgi:hypothetical protein
MEAGIKPALPSVTPKPSAHETAVHLCQICVLLINNLIHTYKCTEQKLILNLLGTVSSHMSINTSTIPYVTNTDDQTEIHSKLLQYQNYIWEQLKNPLRSTAARQKKIHFLPNLIIISGYKTKTIHYQKLIFRCPQSRQSTHQSSINHYPRSVQSLFNRELLLSLVHDYFTRRYG